MDYLDMCAGRDDSGPDADIGWQDGYATGFDIGWQDGYDYAREEIQESVSGDTALSVSPREPHTRGMGAFEDAALRGDLIWQLAATLDDLVSQHADRSGTDMGWLDQILAELRPITEQVHDLESIRTFRDIDARPGARLWAAEDLSRPSRTPTPRR